MRTVLSALVIALISLLFFAFAVKKTPAPFSLEKYKAERSIRCTPDWNNKADWLDENPISLLPGSGTYQWKINTKSDSAQIYFNQGINMYYGFHIIESLASFQKAAAFDPKNPMIWWAHALAYGPNINDVGYAASPEALSVTQKAVDLSVSATPVEKALIEAMAVRYSADSTKSREALNQAYVDKMKAAYTKFPLSADVAALYADALMLQHPWDIWNTNGTPKPWEPEIQRILEKLLVSSPNHPGANHYYVHVMEPSPFAAKALPSADRLGMLTPGLSHMVHMPSHIYLRTGNYAKGALVNEQAVKEYTGYKQLFPSVENNAFLYQLHNLHMQVNCALLAGRHKYTVASARELQQAIDTSFLSLAAPMGNYMQYVYMTPVLVNIRMGQWTALLEMPKPSEHHIYATILYHFGRGMAFVAAKDIDAAAKEEQQLAVLLKNQDLHIPLKPFSSAGEGAKTALELLQGSIQLQKNNTAEALKHFTTAVQLEEAMVYNEPRDWLLNPKQYLGAAYLRAGQWQKAQQVFETDLKGNNNNVWSLYGLHQALLKQNKNSEAAKVEKRLKTAKQDTDLSLEMVFL